jgi:hypothetical protein
MFSVIFLFFFLKRPLIFRRLLEYLKCEIPECRPPDLLVSRQMKSDRVDVLEHILDSAIYVALLGLCLSAKDVRDLDLLACLLIVLEEEVPAEGRLHVVDEGALLVSLLVHLLLLLGAVWLLLSAVVQILIYDLLHIVELLALETLQQNVVFYVLKDMGVDATQLLRTIHPLFFLLIIEVLFPDPHSL